MKFRARAFSVVLAAAVGTTLVGCDSAEERAQSHLESGLALMESGKPFQAQLEFRNAIKLQPDNVVARYEMVKFYKDTNNINGAVGQLRAILGQQPNHVDARIDMAEIMLVANQLDEADSNIAVAMEQRPEDVRVRAIRASIDYKRGDREGALAMADGVLEEDPSQVTARLVRVAWLVDEGRDKEALEALDAGLALDDGDLSFNVIRLGLLEKLGRIDDIGPQLERVVEHYPKTDRFREALARWYALRNDFEAAEAQYRAIAENNPKEFQRSLDVARFLNSAYGPARAREELVRLASQPDALVEYDLALAALDLREGDEAAAVERLDKVIVAHKGTDGGGKAAMERAKIHIRNGEYEAADALLGDLLQIDSKNAAALTLRASRYLVVDDNERAIRDLRTALDVAPDDVQAMMMLASAYERDGSRELALERMAQAVQRSEFDPQIVLRYTTALVEAQKVDVAESLLMDAIKRRGDLPPLLLTLAQIKLRQQQWSAAEQIARRLREINPEDEAAARIEAGAALGQRKFSESADILEGLVTKGKDGDAGTISLVRALLAGGDIERAVNFLDQRLADDPDDTTALVLRASILSGRGELELAEEDLQRAIELEPDNAAAYASLARIYNSMGRTEEMSEALEKGVAMNDDDVSLRLTQAMQEEYAGNFDAAIEIYAELYRERPNSAVVANNFASLLADHRAEDPEQVQRAFNIAKRFRDSKQPHLMDTYGWLLHLTGGSAEALPIVRAAAEGLPTNPLVQYHLGVVLAANGQLAQGRQQVQRALQLSEQVNFPQKDTAKEVLARIDALEADALRQREEEAKKRDAARQGVTQ
ncbi:tetratricopeptide repeat protein [Albimonas pacifica]|uniref:Tetratricopeptide repeat-containing protein n=1 Tax=Albimonas pacifica TaxID=1114924 RepID=A0A1I3C434_9RHOB|nr:tetratricopeptide repeat protein [Albimonas pacifica]SFH69304.1 Tetratricopeptide repeat-containing protein [Albimonas pacifica]